jgi:long-chain acyl-CoA synthetase
VRAQAVLEDRRGDVLAARGDDQLLLPAGDAQEAVVVGDAKPYIGALVTIDPEAFTYWKTVQGHGEDVTVADLREDDVLRREIRDAIDEANRAVSKAEGIKRFTILPDDFTIEDGYLTPKLSVRRAVVLEAFADEVEALYR